MIIVNGTIAPIASTGEGFANDGAPTIGTQTILDAIPCNISGSRTRDAKTDEVSHSIAKYEVLIDNVKEFVANEAILTNNRGDRLGTFVVQDTQYLDCVDAVKIILERYAD